MPARISAHRIVFIPGSLLEARSSKPGLASFSYIRNHGLHVCVPCFLRALALAHFMAAAEEGQRTVEAGLSRFRMWLRIFAYLSLFS